MHDTMLHNDCLHCSHFKSSCQLTTTRTLGEQWRQDRCTRAAQVSLCASRSRRPSALVETPFLTALASCLFRGTKHSWMINKVSDNLVRLNAILRFREDRYALSYGVDCAAQSFSAHCINSPQPASGVGRGACPNSCLEPHCFFWGAFPGTE